MTFFDCICLFVVVFFSTVLGAIFAFGIYHWVLQPLDEARQPDGLLLEAPEDEEER